MGQETSGEYASAAPTDQPDCTTCYLTVDHLGSMRLVTDGVTGAVKRRTDYHPFGWEIKTGYGNRSAVTGYMTTDWSNPKFTGKERDAETNLDYSLWKQEVFFCPSEQTGCTKRHDETNLDYFV